MGLGALAPPATRAHGPEEWQPLLASSPTSGAGPKLGVRPRQPPGQGLPLPPQRRIAFDTDEGTWMSVDISPDGRHIVFDLLGDLYALDAAGGRARPLTRGLAFDTQPTYSPDGRYIAFVSDRSGAENLWLVGADGSHPRQVSFGDDDSVLVSPAWSPDGSSLYVSRFLWSVNAYELWRYDLDGTETLIVPIKAEGEGREQAVSSLGAAVSPDGRYVYFARHRADDASSGIPNWSIVRRKLASAQAAGGRDEASGVGQGRREREEEVLLPDPPGPGRRPFPGTFFRPALSPDGTLLAYATRYKGETGLRVRNLVTNEDRWLAYPIERDQLFARSWQDLAPRYAFTPDGSALVLSRHGKLERLPITGGVATPIPFTAHVELPLGMQTRVAIEQETGPVRARLMQTPEQSPDGEQLAFCALGHIYVMALDGRSAPRRLTVGHTPEDLLEFHPSWSPDGRSITYITWTAQQAGHVWIVPAQGGAPRRLTLEADFYTHPVFTPDGQQVLAVRANHRGRLQTFMDIGQVREAKLVALAVAGGSERVIYEGRFGSKPHFSAAHPGAALLRADQGLMAIDLTSGRTEPSAQLTGPGWYFLEGAVPVDDSRLSPDGKWVLAQVAQQLHLLAAPPPGETVDLADPGRAHRRITDVGADFFEWADGGATITWSIGSTFYRRPLADIELSPAAKADWSADVPVAPATQAFHAQVTLPRDVVQGSLLLCDARLITMRGEEVIERGDILVRDGRIAAIAPSGTLEIPEDTQVRDLAGKTIVPGFIDIHDHIADIRRDVLSTDSWGLQARLAYGVTTAFDPSSLSIDMFAYQDLVDAGKIVGSRVATTGMAMFSFNRLSSIEEARALLRRYRDHYRTRNAKQYLIGNRKQRQWLVQAAAELGMMPTTEGSLAFKLDVTQIMDGFAGSEHALPTPLYRDVIELLARSGTSYDATLQIQNGGFAAQDNFVIRDRPLTNEKFMRLRPYGVAAQSALSRPWIEPSIMLYPRLGGDAARIQRAGGVVGMGSHGEIPGPGFHWEMEAHVQGGMTPWEALRAGTIGSATAIGRAAEFGSLEVGKYADLIILDSDPREDIRRSQDIAEVMKGGRLYDADTLEELWPRRRPLDPPWFADEAPTPR